MSFKNFSQNAAENAGKLAAENARRNAQAIQNAADSARKNAQAQMDINVKRQRESMERNFAERLRKNRDGGKYNNEQPPNVWKILKFILFGFFILSIPIIVIAVIILFLSSLK